MKKTNNLAIISVMFCFFCMGFVDLVGIASNYVKADLHLSDSVANIFPSLVFFWFLIFSVPTGVLMNKIGRKKTVLLSLGITALSLLLPLCGESFAVMLCAFSLLGIGNALMQTSLNPLVTCVMGGGHLAAVLTFGQFIKAIASFIAPTSPSGAPRRCCPPSAMTGASSLPFSSLLVSLQQPCLPPLKSANRRPQVPPMVSAVSSLRPSPCWANPSCYSPS